MMLNQLSPLIFDASLRGNYIVLLLKKSKERAAGMCFHIFLHRRAVHDGYQPIMPRAPLNPYQFQLASFSVLCACAYTTP